MVNNTQSTCIEILETIQELEARITTLENA